MNHELTAHQVEKSENLKEVFSKYSQFKGQSHTHLQFTYNGKTIKPDDSPASLEMSDDDNTIKVSLTGQALTKETIAQACTSGSTSTAVNLLSENNELCSEQLTWFDSDGQELSTPPIFICIDYGHVELVEKLLPLYKDILNTVKDGDGDYSPLVWASWTVGIPGLFCLLSANLLFHQTKHSLHNTPLFRAKKGSFGYCQIVTREGWGQS